MRPVHAAALALGLCLGLGPLAGCGGEPAEPAAASAGYHGEEPEPAPPRPSFELVDTDGEPFDFAERTAGKPTLLYFGYTNCPDECPTAMSDIAAAARRAPRDVQDDLQVVFVTTDPERDTP